MMSLYVCILISSLILTNILSPGSNMLSFVNDFDRHMVYGLDGSGDNNDEAGSGDNNDNSESGDNNDEAGSGDNNDEAGSGDNNDNSESGDNNDNSESGDNNDEAGSGDNNDEAGSGDNNDNSESGDNNDEIAGDPPVGQPPGESGSDEDIAMLPNPTMPPVDPNGPLGEDGTTVP